MTKKLESEFKALKAQVDHMGRLLQALGLPTSPWVSPQQAAKIMGTSRARVNSEIERAEYARAIGQKYDLIWGTHYRKNGANWQINPVEFEAVAFQPPDQRPYIELPD